MERFNLDKLVKVEVLKEDAECIWETPLTYKIHQIEPRVVFHFEGGISKTIFFDNYEDALMMYTLYNNNFVDLDEEKKKFVKQEKNRSYYS